VGTREGGLVARTDPSETSLTVTTWRISMANMDHAALGGCRYVTQATYLYAVSFASQVRAVWCGRGAGLYSLDERVLHAAA